MSLWKKFQRVGKKAVKFRFTITYHELVLEYDKKWIPNSVCVIWCRRNRKTASQWKKWEPSIDNAFRGVLTWPIPEVMEFEVTLYRDPDDPQSFEDKEWAIFVEDRGKDGRKKQQIAASTTIDLNRYVGGCCGLEPGHFDLRLNLKPNGKKVKEASLAFSIGSTFLKEGKATDEDMRSIASMMSFAENGDSTIGEVGLPSSTAHFSPDRCSYESPGDASFGARVNEMTREWSSLLVGPKNEDNLQVETAAPPSHDLDDKGGSYVDLEIASSMFAKCNPPTSSSSLTTVPAERLSIISAGFSTPPHKSGKNLMNVSPTSKKTLPHPNFATATSPPSSPGNSFPYKASLNGGYYGSLRVKNGQFISTNGASPATSQDKPSLANRLATSFRRKKSKVGGPQSLAEQPSIPRGSLGFGSLRSNDMRTTLLSNKAIMTNSTSPDPKMSDNVGSSPERSNLDLPLASSTITTAAVQKECKPSQSDAQAGPAVTYPNLEATLRSPAIDLLEWCKEVTSYYPGLRLDNFTSSFRDGRAFCAIVNHFQPNTIDVASLVPQNVEENNRKAFKAASDLGIPPLLEPYEMIHRQEPDKLAVITYLFQLKTFFERRAKEKASLPIATTSTTKHHHPVALVARANSVERSSENAANFKFLRPKIDANPNPTSLDELVSETSSYLLTNDESKPSERESAGLPASSVTTLEQQDAIGVKSTASSVITLEQNIAPSAMDRRAVPAFRTVCPSARSFPIYRQLPKPHKAQSLLSMSRAGDNGQEGDPSSQHQLTEATSVSREKELKTRALQLIKDAREKARASMTPPIRPGEEVSHPDIKPPSAEHEVITSKPDHSSAKTPAPASATMGKVMALTNEYDFQWSDSHIELTPSPLSSKRPSIALSKLGSAFSSHVQRLDIKENDAQNVITYAEQGNVEKEINQPSKLNEKPVTSEHDPTPPRDQDDIPISKAKILASTNRAASATPPSESSITNGYAEARSNAKTLPASKLLNDANNEKFGSPSFLAYSALRYNGTPVNSPADEAPNRSGPQPDWVGVGSYKPSEPVDPQNGSVHTRGKYFKMEFDNIATEQNALDEQASRLENQIRDSMINKETQKENDLMREWFVMVDKKNSLLRQQTQLNIMEHEKNLEKKYDMLKIELQKIIDLPVFIKTMADEEKEKALIEELVNVVNQRDELVQHLDDQEQGLQEDQAITTKLLSSSRQLFYSSLPRKLKRNAQELPSNENDRGSNQPPYNNDFKSRSAYPTSTRSKMAPGSMATLPANFNAKAPEEFLTDPPQSNNPADANCLLQ